MGERTLFPNASNKATLAYCWRQMQPDRAAFAGSCVAIVLGTLANAVAAPLIFAALLARIADTGAHHQDVWSSFGPLIVAYAVVLVAATAFGRIGGWLNWGATLRSFGRAITNGYDHLIGLSHGWHTDRPSGEVIATLETSTWAFVELIDAMVWGILRISVTTLGAIIVLGIVAWPVAVVMAGLVAVFAAVLHHRMGRVVAAEKEFSDAHSRATGVIADTIANLTTVRSQAAERREKDNVGMLVGDSLSADLRATAGVHRDAAADGVRHGLLQLGGGRRRGRAGAASRRRCGRRLPHPVLRHLRRDEPGGVLRVHPPDVACHRPLRQVRRHCRHEAGDRRRPRARRSSRCPGASSSSGTSGSRIGPARPSSRGWTCGIEAGEHVGLVGPSGSGKTTLTKLLLRFADRDDGVIAIDGQDIARVTQQSLRRHIAYVPQDPQMLHRTIAENICYGLESPHGVDMDLVRSVGRAAYVDEFVERLPDGYDTVVGERGLKLSGGQRQRVAIAQAMAKGARVLVLDEATSALDSESESLVQEALWHLMEGTTALVVAHRLATIARLDRIVVLDQGRVVEQGTHGELLSKGRAGVYGRLWAHQSGGFLAA